MGGAKVGRWAVKEVREEETDPRLFDIIRQLLTVLLLFVNTPASSDAADRAGLCL